jgi:hypothetical protein
VVRQTTRLARMMALLVIVTLLGCGRPFDRWHTQQVIDAFVAAGLGVQDLYTLRAEDYGSAPHVAEEAISFVIRAPCPCNDGAVRVYSFASRRDLVQMQSHLEKLRETSGLVPSRIYVKDNIVMQVSGDLPEQMAKQYERVLNHLG